MIVLMRPVMAERHSKAHHPRPRGGAPEGAEGLASACRGFLAQSCEAQEALRAAGAPAGSQLFTSGPSERQLKLSGQQPPSEATAASFQGATWLQLGMRNQLEAFTQSMAQVSNRSLGTFPAERAGGRSARPALERLRKRGHSTVSNKSASSHVQSPSGR